MPEKVYSSSRRTRRLGSFLTLVLGTWLVNLLLGGFQTVQGQGCPSGNSHLVIAIRTDNYPSESSYILQNQSGTVLASRDTGYFTQANTNYYDTLCIPNTSCLIFTMKDSYGDGLCCGYGNGQFQLWWNGSLTLSGGNFTYTDSRSLNCAPTQSCQTALNLDTGNHLAPSRNSWYNFQPRSRGRYTLSTCAANSTFNTKIWVYPHCNVPVLAEDNMGTVLYNDSSAACGIRAEVMAFLDTNQVYKIRIGGDSTCNGPIPFRIQYDGPIPGCMDPLACNYDPLATVSGTCYYYPNPLCPPGPDLTLVQTEFENSLQRSTVTANTGNCWVAENCLTGYGQRTLIRFTTDIRNIGITDYFIGSPSTHPGQFSTVNCHGHAHYEGYAEYVLYPTTGNRIPVGFKNGFCVMDLSCPAGIPAKYGCGNMGITAGCGDIYSSGLDCQWIDITDVPAGDYILAAKVNWDQSPDALGRSEMNYQNNWAQVCLRIYTDSSGQKQYSKYPNCAPYTDCNGVPYGNAVRDCRGVCAGTALSGDINQDSARNSSDVPYYLTGLVTQQLPYSTCADLSGDSALNVWDAVLLGNCLLNNNTGQACSFPRGLQSAQTHQTKILAIDTIARYVDIGVRNPQHRLTGLDFEIHGIRPLQVMPLNPPGSGSWQFTYTNMQPRVLGISQNLTQSLPRDSSFHPLLRIFYSRTSDTVVYLQRTHAATNEFFENLICETDTMRWPVTLDRTAVHDLHERPVLRLYPNPHRGPFTLEYPPSHQPAAYRILNLAGQVCQEGLIADAHLGRTTLHLDSPWPSGIYLLEFKGPLGRNSVRFLKTDD